MPYLVTGVNPGNNSGGRYHALFDTEQEARTEAERLVRAFHNEVAVWKQITTPKLEQIITWEEKNASSS